MWLLRHRQQTRIGKVSQSCGDTVSLFIPSPPLKCNLHKTKDGVWAIRQLHRWEESSLFFKKKVNFKKVTNTSQWTREKYYELFFRNFYETFLWNGCTPWRWVAVGSMSSVFMGRYFIETFWTNWSRLKESLKSEAFPLPAKAARVTSLAQNLPFNWSVCFFLYNCAGA